MKVEVTVEGVPNEMLEQRVHELVGSKELRSGRVNATRCECRIKYVSNQASVSSSLKSLHFILAQSGNSIIATACPLKSS